MPTTATKMPYETILSAAFAKAAQVPRERGIGCGRIYVIIVDKAQARGIAKAAKALGKIFQRKGYYGITNALYVGYDNCDGRALAHGTAIVTCLQAHGIACYRDEHGD